MGDFEIHRAHCAMMARRMVLGMIVAEVLLARSPVDKKLSLSDAIANPVETHIHGFGAFLLDCVVGKSRRRGVVGLHGCGWLRVSKFGEGDADGYGFLAIVEKRADFGFSGRGHYVAENVASGMDWAIERRAGSGRFCGIDGLVA